MLTVPSPFGPLGRLRRTSIARSRRVVHRRSTQAPHDTRDHRASLKSMRARASIFAIALLVVSSAAFAQKKPAPAPKPKPQPQQQEAAGTTPVLVSVQSTKKIKV